MDSIEDAGDESSWDLPEEAGPQRQASRQQQMAALRQALAELPERRRRLVELNLQGFGPSEAGELVGLSADAARKLMERGMKCLRERLEALAVAGGTERREEGVSARFYDAANEPQLVAHLTRIFETLTDPIVDLSRLPGEGLDPDLPLSLVAGGAVQPVSYRKPPTLRVSRPVGLAPCAQGAFATDDCWRKGDEHILFPSDAPLGEPSSLVSPVPSDAD